MPNGSSVTRSGPSSEQGCGVRHTILAAILLLGCNRAHALDLHLYSRQLAQPIQIADDAIWLVEVHGKFETDVEGSGTLILRNTRPAFTKFGDATFHTKDKVISKGIKFRALRVPANRGRRIYEIVGSDGPLANCFHLVVSEDAKEEDRLLVLGEPTPPGKNRGYLEDLATLRRRITMYRTPELEPMIDMPRPVPGKIYLRSAYQIGKGHYEIRGEIGGSVGVTRDQKAVELNEFGDETCFTLALYSPKRVVPRELKTVDPLGQGRQLFLLDGMEETTTQQYLVLSPYDGGPHRLILRQGEQLENVLPLFDPIRERYQIEMASRYEAISEVEAATLKEIIKIIGYDWSWKSDLGHVTVLNLNDEVGVSEVVPLIAKLSYLRSVYLSGYGISDEAALQLCKLKHLRKLNIRKTLLLRSTVDELQSIPGLDVIPPELSVVPEERAVVGDLLHGGVHLQADDRGHVISASDADGQLLLPMPPQEIVRKLAALPMLRSLDCTEMGITKYDIPLFGQLSRLEQLELGDLLQESGDLAALRKRTQITTLSLQLPELTASICDEFRSMKSLGKLSLFVFEASDATLVHLNALDCLHSLSVNGNISSAGVQYLRSFPNLERLWVNSALVTLGDE